MQIKVKTPQSSIIEGKAMQQEIKDATDDASKENDGENDKNHESENINQDLCSINMNEEVR